MACCVLRRQQSCSRLDHPRVSLSLGIDARAATLSYQHTALAPPGRSPPILNIACESLGASADPLHCATRRQQQPITATRLRASLVRLERHMKVTGLQRGGCLAPLVASTSGRSAVGEQRLVLALGRQRVAGWRSPLLGGGGGGGSRSSPAPSATGPSSRTALLPGSRRQGQKLASDVPGSTLGRRMRLSPCCAADNNTSSGVDTSSSSSGGASTSSGGGPSSSGSGSEETPPERQPQGRKKSGEHLAGLRLLLLESTRLRGRLLGARTNTTLQPRNRPPSPPPLCRPQHTLFLLLLLLLVLQADG